MKKNGCMPIKAQSRVLSAIVKNCCSWSIPLSVRNNINYTKYLIKIVVATQYCVNQGSSDKQIGIYLYFAVKQVSKLLSGAPLAILPSSENIYSASPS